MTTVDHFAGGSTFREKPARGSSAAATARPKQPALQRLVLLIRLWIERSRQRRELAALSDYQLRDIGLSRADAHWEYSKPFWR